MYCCPTSNPLATQCAGQPPKQPHAHCSSNLLGMVVPIIAAEQLRFRQLHSVQLRQLRQLLHNCWHPLVPPCRQLSAATWHLLTAAAAATQDTS